MKYLICEGSLDAKFFNQVLTIKLDRNPLIIKDIKKAQRTFRRRNYVFLKQNYDSFIFEDKGRPIIYRNVLTRLIIDCFQKFSFPVNFLLVIDDDHVPHDSLADTIFSEVHTIIKSRLESIELRQRSRYLWEVFSQTELSPNIFIHLFFIPISLEHQIIDYCQDNFEKILIRKKITKSTEMGIHKKLKLIKNCLGFNNDDDLVKRIIEEDWFEKDSWFKELFKKMNRYF